MSAQGSDPPRELRLDLPAAHSAVRMARRIVRTFASALLGEEEVGTIELVASELLSNAVDHGGGHSAMEEADLEEPVRMELYLEVGLESWRVEVSDQGGGDPRGVEELLRPEAPPDLDDERGRGFFLMAQMVDELSVRPTDDGRGLVLAAEKRHGGAA